MIREVAKKVKVSSDHVRAFEKAAGTRLMKFLDKIVSRDFIDRLISEKYGYMDEKGYVDVVRSIIQELYEQGDMVIIGRGSQYILKGCENTWHILLVGDLEHRIRFIADKYQLTDNEAQKAIKRADQIRGHFLDLFSVQGSHDDPLSYDMVLNMRTVSMEKAEELIVELISE